MSSELKPPIFLFGNTRSGTTIVQKMVSLHPDVVKWYEPRTLWLIADPGRNHDEFDEGDATEKVKRHIRKQFLKYQKENGNCVVMEKTPANILKIPYVRAIFPEASKRCSRWRCIGNGAAHHAGLVLCPPETGTHDLIPRPLMEYLSPV